MYTRGPTRRKRFAKQIWAASYSILLPIVVQIEPGRTYLGTMTLQRDCVPGDSNADRLAVRYVGVREKPSFENHFGHAQPASDESSGKATLDALAEGNCCTYNAGVDYCGENRQFQATESK